MGRWLIPEVSQLHVFQFSFHLVPFNFTIDNHFSFFLFLVFSLEFIMMVFSGCDDTNDQSFHAHLLQNAQYDYMRSSINFFNGLNQNYIFKPRFFFFVT